MPNQHEDRSAERAGFSWGCAGIVLGLVIFLGAMGSCASDTQPHPPGWLGVAPHSWAVPLALLSVVGLLMVLVGAAVLLRSQGRNDNG